MGMRLATHVVGRITQVGARHGDHQPPVVHKTLHHIATAASLDEGEWVGAGIRSEGSFPPVRLARRVLCMFPCSSKMCGLTRTLSRQGATRQPSPQVT